MGVSLGRFNKGNTLDRRQESYNLIAEYHSPNVYS